MTRSASLRVLLDHTQDKIALLDEAGTYTYLNAAAERILGYDTEALVGDDAFEYIHPDDVADVRRAFERTIESESFATTTVEYRHRTSDDAWVWLESRMSNLTDSELDGYVVSSRDITDRVTAERERREAALQLEELAATSSDVLWMFDGEWTELLFVNSAYEEVYGRPVDELRDDPVAFLNAVHPDDVPAVEAAMRRLSAGESVDIEYRVHPGEDYGRWVWVQAEPIVENGDVVRITGFTRDITERRQREQQLYVMDNLLRHNLRNDLNVIVGNADRIAEQAPEVSDRIDVIKRTGENLLASANKERTIIDLITKQETPTNVDVCAAVERAVETIRERFPAARVEVSLADDALVYAQEELRLAVAELVENAIRHSHASDPTVRVTVRTDDEAVSIIVADGAPPIPDIEKNVLVGDHDVSDVYHSSGLGLWLVYWVVELADGDVTVASDDGGNRVALRFPRQGN